MCKLREKLVLRDTHRDDKCTDQKLKGVQDSESIRSVIRKYQRQRLRQVKEGVFKFLYKSIGVCTLNKSI